MNQFATMSDLLHVLCIVLQDHVMDYDIRAIADDIAEWQDGLLVCDLERPDFWEIVRSHEIS